MGNRNICPIVCILYILYKLQIKLFNTRCFLRRNFEANVQFARRYYVSPFAYVNLHSSEEVNYLINIPQERKSVKMHEKSQREFYSQMYFDDNKMMICIRERYFTFNRITLLAVGLWPYQQTKLVQFQLAVFLGILISFVAFQVLSVCVNINYFHIVYIYYLLF